MVVVVLMGGGVLVDSAGVIINLPNLCGPRLASHVLTLQDMHLDGAHTYTARSRVCFFFYRVLIPPGLPFSFQLPCLPLA